MKPKAEAGGSGLRSEFALWGTRFEQPLTDEASALNRSLPIDKRLWREEIQVSAVWTEALVATGVLGPEEAERIVRGLERVGERLAAGAAEGAPDEDIHTLVERLLGDEVGELAGKLRTGRSRNDQSATGTRLWTMRAIEELAAEVGSLQSALVSQAEATIDVLLPAYTHLQRAQPIRMAHFFLSHFWPLVRDRARLTDAQARASVMPLGSGAVAGSGFAVDRTTLAERLGFQSISPNSLDAVADRDFVAEFAFCGAMLGAHLSRLAEDLILYATSEFGFVRFADAYSTGSSLMPQKRNPDIAELTRGKSARLLGHLTAALSLLKALPSGYNKDLQEDKEILFGVHDTLRLVLPPLTGAVETLQVNAEAAARALDASLLAVDLADAVVRTGVPFHDAHEAVGALVREAEAGGVSVFELEAERVRDVHAALPDVLAEVGRSLGTQMYERSVEGLSVSGSTARTQVLEQLGSARALL